MASRHEKENEKLFGVVAYDLMVQFAALFILMFTIVSSLPHNSDPTTDINLPGKMCIELIWDSERDVDLDLWGKSPDDPKPVGYNRMHGKTLDLIKDVIGWGSNPEHINIELMCANHLIAGEWTFDVMYYSDHEIKVNHDQAITANVFIRIRDKNNIEHIKKTKWTFKGEGEEKTLIDFTIDKDGDIIENSINSINKKIAKPTSRDYYTSGGSGVSN